MTRRVVIALTLIASLALGLAADAGARRLHPQPKVHNAKKLRKASAPSIGSVTPLKANVGEKLTILGKNLKVGKGKTRVFFLRQGGGVTSATPEYLTKTRLVVTIPDTVTPLLRSSGANAVPTRFQLRILTSQYGDPTKTAKSPLIGPASTDNGGGGGGGGGGNPGAGDCDGDGIKNSVETDDDNDLIPDTVEINKTHTDPCKADTDGDGISDGYEYQSALDMNNTTPFNVPDAALPYPGKKPWPNPLDPTDATIDHDGDGLTMADEFQLFTYYGHNQLPLNYSDGKQVSQIVPAPADPALAYMDENGDGVLSDDDRDADGDNIGNWDEKYGRMTQDWWDAVMSGAHGMPKETRYINTFPGTSFVDPDTDGDGVPDGADDQDHDGLTNSFEIARPSWWQYSYVSGRWAPFTRYGPKSDEYQPEGIVPLWVGPNFWARVQPYNPCKPLWSKTCHLHPPLGYYGDDEDWASPDPSYAGPQPAAPWL